MFADEKLREIERAQAAVVLEGEGLRREIQTNTWALQQRFQGITAMATLLPQAKPLLLAGAAAAGFLAFRNFRTVLRWAPSLFSAWKFARQVFSRFR